MKYGIDKSELKKIAENWNASGEYDDTEFEGRYFIGDDDLTEFATDNGFEINDDVVCEIEKTCDCEIISDYDGANPNRQFGDSEIIFHKRINY